MEIVHKIKNSYNSAIYEERMPEIVEASFRCCLQFVERRGRKNGFVLMHDFINEFEISYSALWPFDGYIVDDTTRLDKLVELIRLPYDENPDGPSPAYEIHFHDVVPNVYEKLRERYGRRA